MMVTNAAGRIVSINRAFTRITHYVTLFGELDGLGAERAGIDQAGETQLPERPARSA